MSAMTIYQPAEVIDPNPSPRPDPRATDKRLRHYFDFEEAARQVLQECKSAATLTAYGRDLPIFIKFLDERHALPDPGIMRDYIAMFRQAGAKSTTINRYLAPVRKFCKLLSAQRIDFQKITDPRDMFELWQIQNQIRAAADIKGPDAEETNHLSPLMKHGTRLSLLQARELVASIDRTDLRGQQTYALMVLGLMTGLRVAEMARLTFAAFQDQGNGTYSLTVRGKRNNMTPISCPAYVVDALRQWQDAYNAALDDDDPRRITDTTPIWRALKPYQNIPFAPEDDPLRFNKDGQPLSLNQSALRDTIKRAARDYDPTLDLAPHDLRRTLAYLMERNGFSRRAISRQLRHKSVATTDGYIGDIPDYTEFNPATKFTIM